MQTTSPQKFLEEVYTSLDFKSGDLLDAANDPTEMDPANESWEEDWLEKGEWLSAAKRAGAEKVFFIQNNPVIIFAQNPDINDSDNRFELIRKIWCLARPQLLFLAEPGLLSVHDLTHRPPKKDFKEYRPLVEDIKQIVDVQAKLQAYNRARIELGTIYDQQKFAFDYRADRALIRDIKTVRAKLLEECNNVGLINSLIGKSIFIRYLEDRGIINDDYFLEISKINTDWSDIIKEAVDHKQITEEVISIYINLLKETDVIIELFKKLEDDFNGNVFPIDYNQLKSIPNNILETLGDFLSGKTDEDETKQLKLNFFAYKFDIIPIELISNIYEEFYQGDKKASGVYYTNSSLVEFLLSDTLTEDVLTNNPRILDPACGSGVFLVEAFRRIVRYRLWKQRTPKLSSDELKEILRDQIFGIDIDPEAAKVTAFSLYLAFLHFHEPQDIMKNGKLPLLLYDPEHDLKEIKTAYCNIIKSNAFGIENRVKNDDVRLKFLDESFDVIVGNPPWGSYKNSEPYVIEEIENTLNERAVGDKEYSQAFIHLTFKLLKPKGKAGLLVSLGTIFKSQEKTRQFRNQWLNNVSLLKVVNFLVVRDLFFSSKDRDKSATSPFISVVYKKEKPAFNYKFQYWTCKETTFINRNRIVLLSLNDLKVIRQIDTIRNPSLWKIYMWGGHLDEALIFSLSMEKKFKDIYRNLYDKELEVRLGFIKGNQSKPIYHLPDRKVLKKSNIENYGQLCENNFTKLKSNQLLERPRKKDIYIGDRILISSGIISRDNLNGRLITRYAKETFLHNDSFYSINIPKSNNNDINVILGIFWSSITRYFIWMNSGAWIGYHDKIYKYSIERIPFATINNDKVNKISEIVNKLIYIENHNNHSAVKDYENQLDNTIFDLFDLSEDEIDQIKDMCEVGLDFFYNGIRSKYVNPVTIDVKDIGRIGDLSHEKIIGNLSYYLRPFLEMWNHYYLPENELHWRIIRPDVPLLAVVFELGKVGNPLPQTALDDKEVWNDLLGELNDNYSHPFGSNSIYIDSMVRFFSDQRIVIIKRNEKRLWTKTAAREDAEAMLAIAIKKQRGG